MPILGVIVAGVAALQPPPNGLQANRRAALVGLAGVLAPSGMASADEGRVRAQTVGIDVASPLFDPRDPFGAEKGIVWGGRERCDPTDTKCQQGGIEAESNVQPIPSTPNGVEVTDKVKLTLSVAGEPAGDLVLGLWRGSAPTSVDTFIQLTRGTLAPAEGDAPASYERSVMARVSKDREVVLGQLKKQGGQTMLIAGQTRPRVVPVAAPLHDDSNPITHDQAGLVSVRKGGGSFEFSISTRPAPSLDKDELVIGQVLEGMELVERLNILPTNNYNAGPMATVRIERLAVL